MRVSVAALFIIVVAIIAPRMAFAEYPERPITILVGFGTGSVGDQIARGLAEAVKKHLRQPIVVVNRPGASGTFAISEALKSKPDGYTLGLGTIGTLTVQPHLMDVPYGKPDTYVAVAKLVTQPNLLMVSAGAPWTTAQEFLRHVRAHPGEVSVGVPGRATVAHLEVEQLGIVANLRLKVAYFDGPQQVQAAVLGQIDAAVAGPGPIIPHVRAGKAVALGVFEERRLPSIPDVPTFKELGFDVTLGTIQAVIAPQGIPAPTVKALADAIRKAVAEPSFVALAQKTENAIDYKGPEELAAELRQRFEKNGDLVRALGLKK